MEPSKEQVMHDLAMACVSGAIQDAVIKANRESAFGIISAQDLVPDALFAYKQAWEMLFTQPDPRAF